MTCFRTCHTVSYVREPTPAKWLHLALPPGPRSPRTLSRSMALSGPVISTEANWTHVGSLDIETRQALHEAHLLARRKALIGTLAHLRRKHRSTCEAMADLQAVTNELLAMGDR